MNNLPYRTLGDVPVYEEGPVRKEHLKMSNKQKNANAVMLITSFMSAGLMTIGLEWNNISAPVATVSLISLVVMSIGITISCGLKLGW